MTRTAVKPGRASDCLSLFRTPTIAATPIPSPIALGVPA